MKQLYQPAFCFFFLLASDICQAGLLGSGSLDWGIFSWRPRTNEPTPNYHGLSPGFTLGYSFEQVFDLALYGNYIPGSQSLPKVGEENASLLLGGLTLGLRLKEQLFFSLLAGGGQYNLVHSNSDANEVKGKWLGKSGGIAFGSVIKINRQISWQLSMKLIHMIADKINITSADDPDKKSRRLDVFMFSVGYTFNEFLSQFSENSLLR